MQKSPPPFIWASPEEKNMLDCECLVSRLGRTLPAGVYTMMPGVIRT